MENLEVQAVLNSIPQDQHNAFMMEYGGRKKDVTVGVLLAILLGGIGAHHFYMGNIGLGIAYLVFSWTGIPLIIGLIEGFMMPDRIRKHNMNVAYQIASMLK